MPGHRFGVLLHEGTGEELPFENDSFEIVIASGATRHTSWADRGIL
jgi:ubiquinone/menaquinone biosynthesis C-methylase UbiE